MSQQEVGLGLVTGPVALQPFDQFSVKAHGDWHLRRPIELAHLGTPPVDDLRHLGKMSSSFFASTAAISRFCSFVSLFIAFSIARCCGANARALLPSLKG